MRRFVLLALLASCGGEAPATPPEVQRLLDALVDGRPEGRAIARLGPADRAAVPAIVALLERDDRRAVLVPLLEALGNIGDPLAAAAAEKAIANRDALVSLEAAATHWRLTGAYAPGLEAILQAALGHGPAQEAALHRLEDVRPLPAEAVRDLAAVAKLMEPERDPPVPFLRACAAAGPQVADAALAAIREARGHAAPDVRAYAHWALHRVGGRSEEAARALLADVSTMPPFGRRTGLALLAGIAREAPEAVLPVLREALRAPEPVARLAAAHVAGETGAAAAPLRDDLAAAAEKDESADVRAAAADALRKITPR